MVAIETPLGSMDCWMGGRQNRNSGSRITRISRFGLALAETIMDFDWLAWGRKLLGSNRARLRLLSLAVVILLYAPPSADAQTTVFAAVAPNARTTTIGNVVTAFATIV